MDGRRFDDLARSLAAARSRRGFAKLVIGGALAGLATLGGRSGGGALSCRKAGRLCLKPAHCCSGLCEIDNLGHRRCVCPPGTTNCKGDCKTPSDFAADPKHCGTCGNACSAAPCRSPVCANGSCATGPDPTKNGASCNDGSPCTTGDHCDNGDCVGAPVVCVSADPCQPSSCDPGSGNCVVQPLGEGAPCPHPNPCAAGATCQSGVCTPATIAICSDCQQCSGGACLDEPDGAPCGQTPSSVCVSGLCETILCVECQQLVGIQCQNLPDGTDCGQNANDVCVSGVCQTILCSNCQQLVGVQCQNLPNGTNCGPNGEECANGVCVLPL